MITYTQQIIQTKFQAFFIFFNLRSAYDNLDAYLLRSMIGQALLEAIGGSTKFSVSKLDASRYFLLFKLPYLSSIKIQPCFQYTNIPNNYCVYKF